MIGDVSGSKKGWSIRFRVLQVAITPARPQGVKYSFTLHDLDGTRLLGFDNAHGMARSQTYDHRHRFRAVQDLVPYRFEGADELICDFFAAVEKACEREGVAFEFTSEDLEGEPEYDPDEPGEPA